MPTLLMRSVLPFSIDLSREQNADRTLPLVRQVADMIVQSLVIFETPVPMKVARLHLVSDILSNSASPLPNAWKYRGAFEARLPAVFDHLGSLYASFKAQAGRLTAEQFKGQISNVLDVLEIWSVLNFVSRPSPSA